ncbi:unnamed protein product, partial [Closterium sp. Naga37s-1]
VRAHSASHVSRGRWCSDVAPLGSPARAAAQGPGAVNLCGNCLYTISTFQLLATCFLLASVRFLVPQAVIPNLHLSLPPSRGDFRSLSADPTGCRGRECGDRHGYSCAVRLHRSERRLLIRFLPRSSSQILSFSPSPTLPSPRPPTQAVILDRYPQIPLGAEAESVVIDMANPALRVCIAQRDDC